MGKLNAHLTFENSKEALEYYQKVFQATDVMRQPIDLKMGKEIGLTEDEIENSTMFGMATIQDTMLFVSDRIISEVEASEKFSPAMSFLLDFNSEDEEEVNDMNSLYAKLAADKTTTIIEELTPQSWGGSIAKIVDKYGISWMLHSQPYSKLS